MPMFNNNFSQNNMGSGFATDFGQNWGSPNLTNPMNTDYSFGSPKLPAPWQPMAQNSFGTGVDLTGSGISSNEGNNYLSRAFAEASSPVNIGGGAGPLGGGGGGFFDNFLGKEGSQGWGGLAIGGASALMNAFMGMKQYGLAKDTLESNKKQFQMNYDAQRATTNANLEDRQRARVASNPGAYQSVGDYMNAHKIGS